jgi:hypothetical protein
MPTAAHGHGEPVVARVAQRSGHVVRPGAARDQRRARVMRGVVERPGVVVAGVAGRELVAGEGADPLGQVGGGHT